MEFKRKLYRTVEEICQGDGVQLGACLDQVRTKKKKNKTRREMKKEKNKKINQERQISTKYVEVTQPCLTDLI